MRQSFSLRDETEMVLEMFKLFTQLRIEYSQTYIKCITKTRLFKYTENFTTKKWNFLDFQISAQNIDCGYSTRRF